MSVDTPHMRRSHDTLNKPSVTPTLPPLAYSHTQNLLQAPLLIIKE